MALKPSVKRDKVASKDSEEVLRPWLLKEVGLTKLQQEYLTRLNDGWEDSPPSSFKEIADYISAKL